MKLKAVEKINNLETTVVGESRNLLVYFSTWVVGICVPVIWSTILYRVPGVRLLKVAVSVPRENVKAWSWPPLTGKALMMYPEPTGLSPHIRVIDEVVQSTMVISPGEDAAIVGEGERRTTKKKVSTAFAGLKKQLLLCSWKALDTLGNCQRPVI